MLHWRPVHPQAVYTACSLSSGPAPMHPSLHNQHPESPDHETVVSSNVYSGSRGARARAGNGSKAHVSRSPRCSSLRPCSSYKPTGLLGAGRGALSSPAALWGREAPGGPEARLSLLLGRQDWGTGLGGPSTFPYLLAR